MPHKHKRDKSLNKSTSDLPPATFANPLPVAKPSKPSTTNPKSSVSPSKKPTSKRKRDGDATDDTPRAFARLMAFQTKGLKPRNGLDDGTRPQKKKRKIATTPAATPNDDRSQTANPTANPPVIPQILPGERMSDFSARVDAALPVSGLIGKGRKVEGIKERKSKMEKRMQRMQAEWREVETRRKEREEEMSDEDLVEESDGGDKTAGGAPGKGKASKKKGKRRKSGDDESDDDPWAAIAAKRNEDVVGKGLVGLHDVVQAPPQFSKTPREKFKVRNGAGVRVGDVPGKAKSLRRREELGEARRRVVEDYRRLMGERREGVGGGVRRG
ncbi:hypothetical protein MMC08_003082 [Hypocenomyce scalaris]|nr:hypothetical protein [Hypocenomyce scalaris]